MENIITKEQYIQLLVHKKCLKCNGDSRLQVEFDKESLEFKAIVICDKCKLFYPFKKHCKSEEELEDIYMQIAESTLEDKGFVNVQVESS